MASTSEQVVECLEAKQSFVVDAGAGSGKTRTLVDALNHLLASRRDVLLSGDQRIVCITYTNVAVDEILTRINKDPLVRVSTIHEFLWFVISPFQKELRQAILQANADAPLAKQVVNLDLEGIDIVYWQYGRRWTDGHISHDDVIELAARLFEAYPKLSRLLVDRFPIIFVDEYQDTHESTMRLLLDDLLGHNPERIIIGLFGDYMQKIYNGVGKISNPGLKLIQKLENYRCSLAVIGVLNNLRADLQQVPGGDNPKGGARFFYADAPGDMTVVTSMRESLRNEGWLESQEKVLMLTRKSIAGDQDWRDLLDAYDKRRGTFAIDDLMRREDEFGEQFQDIEAMCNAFSSGRYGEYLAARGIAAAPLQQHAEKQAAFDAMTQLNELRATGTVGDVLEYLWSTKMLKKPTSVIRLEERIEAAEDPERAERDAQFLEALWGVHFQQVSSFEKYLNDETPFSTHHGVKGEEYENVLVVVDDTVWRNYKFEAVLAGDETKSQFDRTRNLFYVSCSRARENLVVLATSPMSDAAIAGAIRIFGASHVSQV